jgi:hypothetical protein
MSRERENQERPCLHCMMVKLIDDFFAESPATAGSDKVGYRVRRTNCEMPLGFGSTEDFTRLMTRKPVWALELPIAASAWTGMRYCK